MVIRKVLESFSLSFIGPNRLCTAQTNLSCFDIAPSSNDRHANWNIQVNILLYQSRLRFIMENKQPNFANLYDRLCKHLMSPADFVTDGHSKQSILAAIQENQRFRWKWGKPR